MRTWKKTLTKYLLEQDILLCEVCGRLVLPSLSYLQKFMIFLKDLVRLGGYCRLEIDSDNYTKDCRVCFEGLD